MQVHDSRLCLQLEVESTINGKHVNATIDEHGHSSSKWLVGWCVSLRPKSSSC